MWGAEKSEAAEAAGFIFRLVILPPLRSVYRKRKTEYKQGVDYMFTTKGYAAYSAHEPLKPFSFERREPTPDWCARSQGLFTYPLSSYRLVGAGLYPAWVASCSVMYLPFLVVP